MRHGGPKGAEISGKLGSRGNPSGDGGGASAHIPRTLESEVDGEMIGEGGRKDGGSDFEVGVVEGDGDRGGDDGVAREEVRKENTIDTRGPGIRRSGVACDVIEGVGVVNRVVEVELGLESFPEGDEGGGGKERSGGGGVSRIFDEIEVTTEEGGDRRVSGEHSVKERGVEGVVTSRLEVNIENLKGDTSGRNRVVTTKLNPSFGDGGEVDICPRVVGEERGGVDDESAGVCHIQVVAGDDAVRKTGEGEALRGGKMGLLETNNVVCLDEIAKSTRNL